MKSLSSSLPPRSFPCRAHVSCKLYAQQLEQIEPCLDKVKSLQIETLEMLYALHQCVITAEHIFHVTSFATARGCGCALVEMYDWSDERLSAATTLVDKLSKLFDSSGRHQQATIKQLVQSAHRALSCHVGLNLLALGKPEIALPKLRMYVEDNIGDGKSRKSSLLDVSALQAHSRALLACGLSATKAQTVFESSFSLMCRLLGPSAALAIARCQDDLGDCLCKAGLFDAAEHVLLASKKAKVAKFGVRNPLVADTESLLGQVALRRGTEEGLSAAVSHLEECQQTRVAYFGPTHASVASVLLLLGNMQSTRGDWDASLEFLQEGKSILEDVFGKESLPVAYAEVLMGGGVLGKLQAARATAMSAAIGGPASNPAAHIDWIPRFAVSDSTTTEWWRKSMEEEEVDVLETFVYIAEENVRRALETLEKGGASAEDQSQAVAVLSGLLLELGRPEDAEPYARRRLENLKNHGLMWFGMGTGGIMSANRLKSEALCNLIRVRRSLKQTSLLELLMWELLSCDVELYPKTSEEMAQTKALLALTLMKNKKHDEAISWMKRSLHIKIGLYGEGSLKLLPCVRFLADALLELGLLQEAEEQYRDAHTIAEAQLGSNHPETIHELHNIGTLTIKQNKFEDAEPIYVDIISADTSRFGAASPQVVAEMHILAKVQYASGQLDQAERTLKRALQLREALLGNKHQEVAETLILLSALLNDRSKYLEAINVLERALCILRASDDKKQIASCLEVRVLLLLALVICAYVTMEEVVEVVAAVKIKNLRFLKHRHTHFRPTQDMVSIHEKMGQYYVAENRLGEALTLKEKLSRRLIISLTIFCRPLK